MNEQEKVRVDKWLWATRVFKTRTLATTACNAGKVKLKGNSVKPSYVVKIGDEFQVKKNSIQFTFRVIGIIARRKSAKEVEPFIQNITPPNEIEKAKFFYDSTVVIRAKGLGRPTKKERREQDEFDWEEFWGYDEESTDED